jgi:hypothetical protein
VIQKAVVRQSNRGREPNDYIETIPLFAIAHRVGSLCR